MTGPEHYLNAESDLESAARADDRGRQSDVAYWMQAAQVHATLALAAATALSHWTGDSSMPQPDRLDWWRAASGEPAERERQKRAAAAGQAELAGLEAQS